MVLEQTFKAKGRPGSWFAEVDGDSVPCVHNHWLRGGLYSDPALRPDDPKHADFVEQIRVKQKVIVCKSDPTAVDSRRKDYISLASVKSIEFDDEGLRFAIDARLATVIR